MTAMELDRPPKSFRTEPKAPGAGAWVRAPTGPEYGRVEAVRHGVKPGFDARGADGDALAPAAEPGLHWA